MSRDVQVSLIGTMTRDPQLKYTSSGKALAEFGLAVSEGRMNNGKWEEGDASFYDVTAWDQMAENLCESCGKGSRVLVIGTMKQDRWEKDGQKRSKVAITAGEVGPSLRWATANVEKIERSSTTRAAPRQDDPFS